MARKPKTLPRISDESDPLMDPARWTDNPFYKITTPDGKVYYDPSLEPSQIEIIERRNAAVGRVMATDDWEEYRETMDEINKDARRYQRERKKKK